MSKASCIYPLLALLMLLQPGFSQAQCDFERQKDIKLSGKYYYGEGTAVDSITACNGAYNDLTGKIAQIYLDRKLPNFPDDSVLYVNDITYCVYNARANKKSIAYIQMENVILEKKRVNNKQMKVVKIDTKNTNNTGANNDPSAKTPTSADTTPSTNKSNSNRNIVNTSAKHTNIIDSVIALKRRPEIISFLRTNAHNNVLSFTSSEKTVTDDANCYVVIFQGDSLTAVLSKGQGIRTNNINSEHVTEYKDKYKTCNLIWLYVY